MHHNEVYAIAGSTHAWVVAIHLSLQADGKVAFEDIAVFGVGPYAAGSSCSIWCSSCGVSVLQNMSSAKRRLVRNYPSIYPVLH